ncbi:hypothetical protein [Amycolatopsis sp. WQ 127309]|uniref:hypothetical protein n=1 Tax=Amycolatopsis sp. WQ 127309 TaxID=2932773 RepID=UPI001FF4C1C6|nr:hypothetical protein [Amycolatopsis sp. WQ 127309]UOZ07870.1 hypothetical protein MUY22_06175 [Amycolatopsis sp. WQ 127309]
MTRSGLASIAPTVAGRLVSMSPTARRDLVVEVCRLAVDRADLTDPLIDVALAAKGSSTPAARREIQALTERLDEQAWDIQDQVDAGAAAAEDYDRAFRRARAAAAVGFAAGESLESAYDALYEAYYAIGEHETFLRAASTSKGA